MGDIWIKIAIKCSLLKLENKKRTAVLTTKQTETDADAKSKKVAQARASSESTCGFGTYIL